MVSCSKKIDVRIKSRGAVLQVSCMHTHRPVSKIRHGVTIVIDTTSSPAAESKWHLIYSMIIVGANMLNAR